ncbi:homogentisate 1,2-dioxygenase [Sneathiella marina]|uniref:Homogentisate 1,2-dioxygenase n=1 Tax=Sneathiella marina TaxID=2950108 RepID=A0ABY4W3N6_9PROT|nr:homogentisate 1,2-dioxygenase [Sneathiella marina]USG61524.1 homogentisate 1,2-dioxygenase [Sneathiella marina]
MKLSYMSGFGNEMESEALPDALPKGQNSPQNCAYGLYAEQISGTAFTAPRATNARSWLYRMRPSVRHTAHFSPVSYPNWLSPPSTGDHDLPIGQFRWNPVPLPSTKTTFLNGVKTMTTAGDVRSQSGMASHTYAFNDSMTDDYFFNADGEMLIVPEQGRLEIQTELGILEVEPGEISILPRGIMFKMGCVDGAARGYICENYGARFTLPERGPIGANGLANPRDFLSPVAAYEEKDTPCSVQVKWGGKFYQTDIGHSPLDVVAWHGNFAPVKYDLRLFCAVGAILFDHPDPSIFTVLTAPSNEPGTANVDFAIFPARWMVAENTFRPPWYHRNIMSEFMGLIYGQYDAKEEGFVPGGMSLHNMMLPHGPDAEGFLKATTADLTPQKLENTLAFMFETRLPQQITAFAANLETLQPDYIDCWSGLEKRFDGTKEGKK